MQRSGSEAHSHGPLPALLRRGRGGSSSSAADPGAGGPSEISEGAAPGCPRPGRRIPPWREPRLCVPRRVLGARGEAPCAQTAEDAGLGAQPRLCSRGRPAGGSRRPRARGDPSSSPAAAPSPPAQLLTDGATACKFKKTRIL